VSQPALKVHRATYWVDHARNHHHLAFACGLHYTTMVFCDTIIDQLATVRFKGRYCPDLIHTHQSAVTHHVSGQNCR
jgi:hypothetical protein